MAKNHPRSSSQGASRKSAASGSEGALMKPTIKSSLTVGSGEGRGESPVSESAPAGFKQPDASFGSTDLAQLGLPHFRTPTSTNRAEVRATNHSGFSLTQSLNSIACT